MSAQGESYDEHVLSALMRSRPIMFVFMHPSSTATLTDLVRAIGELKLDSLQDLDIVEKNLSQIQDWFDDNVAHTYGEIISQLNAIMTDGRGIVQTVHRSGARSNQVTLDIVFSVVKHSRAVERMMSQDQLVVRYGCRALGHVWHVPFTVWL